MANPYPIALRDSSGVERFAGVADFADPGNQPGAAPLSQVLAAGNDAAGGTIANLTLVSGTAGGGMTLQVPQTDVDDGGAASVRGGGTTLAGKTAGAAIVRGGVSTVGGKNPAIVTANGSTDTAHGLLAVRTANEVGAAGQALVSDGAGHVAWNGCANLNPLTATVADVVNALIAGGLMAPA